MRPRVPAGLSLFLFLIGTPLFAGPERTPLAEGPKFFETQVQPILEAHCFTCHGREGKVKGRLRLTSREALLKGGRHGPAVSLAKPEDSLLLQAINRQDLKMPPTGKLPQAQIDTLNRWVKMGVPWTEKATVAQRHGPPPVDEQARNFWSFRPVVRPKVPGVKNADWAKTPLDAFVLAKLEAAGLQPAPPVSKTSLLRRLSYDLIGLPPRPEEVQAFLTDTSANAYEKVVDRLLASPHYGERWARHWLDLVRYAETNGYEFDQVKPNVWRYRDYVIKSFNEDKPYDRFLKEQLAGDELEPVTADGLIATGYYCLAPYDGGAPDRLQAMYDGLDDLVATTSQVFLGLTANCARCHDHKIDPFPQTDYYRLLAFFHNIRIGGRGSQRQIATEVDRDVQKATVAQYQVQVADLKKSIESFEEALIPHLTGGEIDDFKVPEYRVDIARKHVPEHVSQQGFESYQDRVRQLAALEKTRPMALARALCVSENSRTPPETFVLLRGNPRAKGDKVEPGSGWGRSSPEEQARRSIYVHVKRSLSVPILAAFDAADTDSSCPVRFATTQSTQALGMLNSEFVNEQAQVFANDLHRKAGDDPAAQVRLALWRVTQRQPSAREVERGVEFMTRLRSKHHLAAADTLPSFCLLALNLNEFICLN